MTPPQPRPTRKRTVINVSDPFGTVSITRVRDVSVPGDDDRASSWKEDKILWKTSFNLPAAWQALKSFLKMIGFHF